MADHYARDAHPTELLQLLREGYRGYTPRSPAGEPPQKMHDHGYT